MTATDTRVVLWAAAAVAACAAIAVAVGTSAGARPATLSDDDIASALAADGSGNSADAHSGTGSGPDEGVTVLDSAPGTVTVRCTAGLASLQSWIPHPGFKADDAVQGPSSQASIRFQTDAGDELIVTITCVSDRPTLQVVNQPRATGGAGSGAGPAPSQAPGTGAGGVSPSPDDHGGGGNRGPGGGHGGGGH